MLLYFLVALAAIAVAVALWNFNPRFRALMRGWSTIVEGIIGTIAVYAGMAFDALNEFKDSGWLPAGWEYFAPGIVLAWVILKRLQTKTPVGGRPLDDEAMRKLRDGWSTTVRY